MTVISAFAEIGFVAPLFVVAFAVLAIQSNWRLALCWGGGIAMTIVTVWMLKRDLRQDPVMPHFPSGHVALAVSFYGGLLLIMGREWLSRGARGLAAALAAAVLIGAIEGVSRVALTRHTWLDVAGGIVIGTAGLLIAGCPWAWRSVSRGGRLWLASSLVLAAPFAEIAARYVDLPLRETVGL